MKKKISLSGEGNRADIGEYKINRILPNRYVDAVGPFVFLDHLLPTTHSPAEPKHKVNGTGAHPHRGIATLTYILNGEADHYDSGGNHALVHSGGAQWMKAGNGVVHDESINVDSETTDLTTHALQFWINLPSKNKAESPMYLPVQASDIPKKVLDDETGWLKVIVGAYGELASKVPDYSRQFVYHIHLEAGKKFSIESEKGLEYAAFLPLHDVMINDTTFSKEEFIEFDREEGTIEFNNPSTDAVDIILFGGESFNEPIVAQGPFVMNSALEISEAYRDFHSGKYGKINYN